MFYVPQAIDPFSVFILQHTNSFLSRHMFIIFGGFLRFHLTSRIGLALWCDGALGIDYI